LQAADGLRRAPEMLRRADGRRLFVDPAPAPECPRPPDEVFEAIEAVESVSFDASRIQLATGAVHINLGPITELLDLDPSQTSEPMTATLRGSVRAADGRPLAGVEVGWGRPRRSDDNRCPMCGGTVA
jgi:hypothetical protein